MDNNHMRAMYNSFGTLNRPQNFGDDLYNDKENLVPASPDLTQTGTDEAGNPIMAPVEMPEQKNNPILDNVIEYVSNAGPATGLPGPVAAIGDTVVTYLAGNDEQRQQVVDRMKRFTPQGIEQGLKDVIHSMSNATELEHTKLYENYFYNAEKKNAEIKRIANLLQIDENTFAHNRELYQKAALAADRVERMGKFKKYQDADGNIDMARIYADVPGLLEVQQKHGTAAAALALGNIDGVQSINDVYDNAFSRFAGSVYAGARRGWIADRRSAIWNTARKENRLPTAEEQAQLDEYAAELNTLPKYNYNTVGNVVGAMVGGAAENMAMILKSQGAGFAARLAAGRIGGAKYGEIASNVVSTYVMAQDIAGNQYEELVNKTDAQGRPMYTPEQASWLALSQGIGEAMLEQYSLNQIGKAIFGRSAAKSITEIIKNSPTLEAAKAGVRDYAALKLREAGKAGLISLGAEAFEEFTQSASDMLMENMAQIMLRGKNADLSSVEDILTTSTGQMVEALPAIGGFGLIGFGMNPIANTSAVLGFRSSVRNVVNNKIVIGRMANAHYTEVLDGVWKNKGNIKELQDKAPEAVTTILDEQNRRAGMEDGFVDLRALAEENAELVNQIAEANDISKEELAACLDGSGMLQVKTSTLMQLELKDEQHKKLMDNVTTSLDSFTLAQENSAIKLVKEQMDSLQNYNDKTYKQAVDNIIAARFPDAEQAALAREIIEANYDNPQEEFKRRLNAINAELDEYIAPVLKELKSGMKQGVDIIRMEGDRDANYVKQSNNADWYRNWYADYGRAPNAEELRGLAIDIASGRQDNRYGLMDYQNNTDETRAYFAPVAETLDRLEEERNALLAIQDRMRNLNPGEMVATVSLSPEGLKVYDAMIRMMGESENKDVQKAGRFNALFLARYADNMAKVFSRVQNRPYTAEDFVRDRFRIDVNANYNEDDMAAQLFQVSPEEFNRQKAEVRKQYEGTDQWMKAPNGEDTNLSEDQWVTVRTAAFKNWFGDWENDPANASKIVDENGEPRPFYHGTQRMDRVGDTFLPERATSGPMAFFTSSKEIATNYSKDKIDTNLQREASEYKDQFTVTLSNGKKVNIVDYWNHLSAKEKNAIRKAAGHVTFDDEADNIISDPNVTYGVGNLEYKIKNSNGNVLQALVDEWLTDGNIWGSEEKFLDVLKLAGVKAEVEYLDPKKVVSGVFDVYLNIRNPFNTNNIDEQFIHDLEEASKSAKEYHGKVSDMWDKGRQTPAQFVERVKSDYEAGTTHAWTSIPDWVTDMLKSKGYDGILDKGGKNGGQIHDVAIPFASNQIKDATGRNVGFDPESGNIYLQMAGSGAVGADLPALNKAMKMYDEGYLSKYSMKDIYDATGWLRGEDGRWRFEIPDTLEELNKAKGRAIYLRLSGLFLEDDVTSKKLNEYGIKGITYWGGQDGRSFVVFDDNAIKVLEKYYQQGRTAKGAISLTEQGQKIISLFESADQSTFIHEMAHMFLMDLQDIAGLDPESQQAKDLKTIMDWAQYKPGQVDEYKGTASAAEFRKRDADIKVAEEAGDTAKAQQLKDAWAQERFARGFEEYLRSGEAPAQGLKRAFRAFKKWLVQIYNDVLGAGVRATPEVEAIMARMVASEEEIDAMEAANSISRKVVDMGNMPQIAAEKLKDMQDEAHEQAKERMLKRLIRDYENNNLKELDEKLKQVRKDAREELKNLPCFVVQKLLDEGLDMESALEIGEFSSEQDYKAALEQAGGTLDKAVYRAVAAAKKQILGQMPGKEQLYDMAQEALDTGIHNTEMSEIEAGILESLKEEYNSVTAKLRRAFEEIDSTLDMEASAEMLEALKKSIRNLKYAERWGAQEFVLIKEFENAANKLDEADREAVERLREKYERIKEKTLRNKEWVNGIIDANKGMAKVIREQAEYKLNGEPVSVATNPRYWHRQALSSAKRAWDGLKTIRKGQQVDYEDAVRAKRQQAVYEAMEAQAYENQKKYNTWLNGRNGFKAKAQRMANPKFKADANLRFYYNHLMYIYGIRTADAAVPTNLKSITEVLNDLRESQQLGVEPPAWIVSAANSTDPGRTYQQLTMSELEQLKKTTDMFYRLATIQNALLTSDDSLDKVEAECALDYENQVGYEGVGNQRINEVKGAMGSYMASMIKSERFLAWLGGEHGAHIKRIYRTLFDAAENEEMEQEKEAQYLRDLYGKHYTKQELRAILNDPVMVTLPDGGVTKLSIGADTNITKENLICMALNWGNELNRARLAVGLFNCQTDAERLMREAELFQILQDNLTENDWNFVQEMWDHIDSFADPVSRVLEKMIGIPLTRVKRQPFEVQMKDGKILRLAGGYYPIVKDPGKSTRVSEFEQIEEAKQIGGISAMGTGMGTTKERDENLMLNQGPLKLNLDVAHRHIEQQIHIITMRMAVRDAYKILNSKTVRGEIERTFGTDVMKSMNEWVLASWAAPIRTSNRAEQIAASLRSGSIGAIMAYRASTALLNFANIVYMANEIGPVNAVNAVIEFYKHPWRNRDAIMATSVYMRNRATNMDRDLGAQDKAILKRYDGLIGKAENAVDKATGGKTAEVGYLIDKYANKLIEETDMFFSLPLYWWQFRQTYDAELAKEGVTEEEARDTANFEATRRVTKVFPSSRKIDSSEVQRSRSEFVKLLTPFFGFSNTMMNAVWNKYYEGKYNGRVVLEDENGNPVLNENGDPVYTSAKKDFIRRYLRFAMAFFMDFMVGAFFETMLRQVPDMLAGTGEDDEDDMFGIGWFKVNKKKYMNNALDSITGGFYGLNAMIDLGKVAKAITEGKSTYGGGRNIGVLSGTVERSTKAIVDLALMLNGSDKIDMLDFMRDASKVYTARTGFSDTLTDAFFNTMRFATDEGYSMDNMADLREYIAKSIFDRKLKKK